MRDDFEYSVASDVQYREPNAFRYQLDNLFGYGVNENRRRVKVEPDFVCHRIRRDRQCDN
ncbi:MAG: hypothetical protein EBU57_03515 [Alphaproteobacteria bacterium]|jgi:hypothetical protein|nr:hypothetical protein [Alphaproteobacteria bacterium]